MIKFILIISLFISSISFSQELEKDYIDEFTNDVIKRTSWEWLTWNSQLNSYFRVSNLNGVNYFDLKMSIGMKGSVFSIDKGEQIMFKLENGEIVKLSNLEYELTCNGCGARGFSGSNMQGINVSYIIESEQLEKLRNNKVITVRIYTSQGYVEGDIRKKYSNNISKAINLL